MRGFVYFAALATAATLPGAAAVAQERSGVDDYLCTFAGKCGDAAPAEEVKAAPATKGFSLARSKPQQTTPAPDTKGFSLARPKQQAAPAPETRGFALSRPAAAKKARAAAAARARPARATAAASRAAPSVNRAVATGARADLMLSFELNSAEMTGAAKDRAKVFAQALNTPELKSHRFVIEGHTDSVGGRAANRDLSQRRAQSVADFLVGQGVGRDRLQVQGLGYDRPLPGKSARDEENRRVEAALIS
jgi:outer membrane protein OmpA-like peptidoglycan-associated protein